MKLSRGQRHVFALTVKAVSTASAWSDLPVWHSLPSFIHSTVQLTSLLTKQRRAHCQIKSINQFKCVGCIFGHIGYFFFSPGWKWNRNYTPVRTQNITQASPLVLWENGKRVTDPHTQVVHTLTFELKFFSWLPGHLPRRLTFLIFYPTAELIFGLASRGATRTERNPGGPLEKNFQPGVAGRFAWLHWALPGSFFSFTLFFFFENQANSPRGWVTSVFTRPPRLILGLPSSARTPAKCNPGGPFEKIKK